MTKIALMICILFFFTFHTISPVYGTPSYNAEEVWTKLNSGDSLLLIDTRKNEHYIEGHIPTAINIPFSGSVNQSIINVITSYNWSEAIAYCSCENGEYAKSLIDLVLDYNLPNAFYMLNDFRYWPYTIITGSRPGTLDIDTHTSLFSSSAKSTNIEPFLIINVVLGVVIIVILFQRRKNN